jgi:hypothetical protein
MSTMTYIIITLYFSISAILFGYGMAESENAAKRILFDWFMASLLWPITITKVLKG